MPTTIPVRLSETRSDDGLVSFCLALLPFYVVLALVLLSITGVETHNGVDAVTCTTDPLQASSSQHCTDSPVLVPG